MAAADDLEGEVFERPVPVWLGFAFVVALVLVCFTAPFGVAGFDEVRALVKQLPWVDADVFAGLLVVATTGGGGLLILGFTFWASRRYGRAVITRDHVVITPVMPKLRKHVVPRDDVRALRETPYGLLLDPGPSHSRAHALLLAPLVPAGDADLARAHELLDPSRRVARPEASASGVVSNMAILALVVPVFALLLVPAWWRITDALDVMGQVLGASWALLAAWLVVLPGRRRVHLGEETVSVGDLCGRWKDVRTFAAWNGWIAVQIGGLKASANVGRDAVARLTPLARAKVTVDEVAPTWERRRRVALAVAFALTLGLYTLAGPIAAFTAERTITVMDHHGYGVAIVYRALDAAPRLIVVADPPVDGLEMRRTGFSDSYRTAGTIVYLESGVVSRRGVDDFTFPGEAVLVRVSLDRVDTSSRALPTPRDWPHGADGRPANLDRGLDLLEDWFPDATDPMLRDLLDGRTTTRCFAVQTTDGWLLTQVREGEVVAVGVLPRDKSLGLGPDCVTCTMLRRRPGNAAAAAVRWLDPRPTLDQVLAAQRLVRRGVSLDEAMAGWPR